MNQRDIELEEFLAHFESKISQELCDYVRDVVLLKSRYVFLTREKGCQYGHCTHCKAKYRTNLNHNDDTTCPNCSSACIAKKAGLGRKHLYDASYVVVYEKSVVNPAAMVARGITVQRDYSGDYTQVVTKFHADCLYLFEMGNSKMYRSNYHSTRGYYPERTVHSDFYKTNFHSTIGFHSYCPEQFLLEAIKGTPYQYSTWESYRCGDNVKFFDLYSKHPCVEYLTKLKMNYFVLAKLDRAYTYGAINWNGKSIDKVLKLEKSRVKEFLRFVEHPSGHPLTLRLFQISCKEKSELTLHQLNDMAERYDDCFEALKKVLKYTALRRADGYIQKQQRVERQAKRPCAPKDILGTWYDYIGDCIRLGFDLTNDMVLFPSNLHRAHLNTIKQVKVKENKELDEKIKQRKKRLDQYHFEHSGYLIRAAADTAELIIEGKVLHHCVGTYADRYAKGDCDILVIRKIEDPDIPFFTMQISGGKIVQCRGHKNCDTTNEVKQFIDKFQKERLEKKPKQRPDKKKPQEVAV
ncbi:PcfJ domain-containing protein [Paenibacillus sp. YYML68]|uniref:PcfJ domain-containing protein n=1 Tax=Paenibacillus sp. YYML68 TaxID=2909250 RepID=UPI002492CF14|nr:PcfJ domain-containing protein [Paenibacillus sp. YYML68]